MANYYQSLIFVFTLLSASWVVSVSAAENDITALPALNFAFSEQPLTAKEPKLKQHSFAALSQVAKLVKAGDIDAAISELKLAIAQEESPALWYSLAQMHQQNNSYQEAESALRQALRLLPGFARAHQALGGLLVRQGKHEQARKHLMQALSTMPSGYIYSLLGYGYLQQQQYLPAQMAYQNAMVLDVTNVQYQRGLLQAAIASHDLSLAQAVMTPLIKAAPNDSKLWQLKANLALKQQEYQAATSALEVAEQLKPKLENRRLLAQLYLKQQQFVLAQPYLFSLLNDASYTDMQLLSNALVFMTSSAPTAQTQALITKMWQLPQLPSSVKSQLHLTTARFALAENKITKAKKQLKNSVQSDGKNGQALLLLANLEQGHNVEYAQMLYSRAALIPEFRVRAKVALAQLLIGQQSYSRAYGLLKEVQKLEPNERKHRDNIALVERLLATTAG